VARLSRRPSQATCWPELADTSRWTRLMVGPSILKHIQNGPTASDKLVVALTPSSERAPPRSRAHLRSIELPTRFPNSTPDNRYRTRTFRDVGGTESNSARIVQATPQPHVGGVAVPAFDLRGAQQPLVLGVAVGIAPMAVGRMRSD
jgi:hypothetical protein